MKLLRVGFSIIFLLSVVCAIALTALILLIDPNQLKPVIEAELQKQTGYEVKVEGNFAWSFYPRIGIKVDRIALFLPKEADPFVDLNQVTFVTELKSLLHSNQQIQGDIYIANLKLLNVVLKNAYIGLQWQNQGLTLQPIKADLYDGKLGGVAHISDLSGLPHWDLDFQADKVKLLPLLQDINHNDNKLNISGQSQWHLTLVTEGKTRDQVLNHLNGLMRFDLQQGVIDRIDLNYLVQSADAIINKKPLSLPTNIAKTDFNSLIGSVVIKNGIAAINDLTLDAPSLKVTGIGTANLIDQVINMQLRVAPQKEQKVDWTVPVMISGDLYSPEAKLDTAELNMMAAKEKLDNVKLKVNNEIKAHISSKTAQMLKKLIGK